MSELEQAVRAVVRDCLGVREGEEVLVVCNPATQRSASAAGRGRGRRRRRGAGRDLRARLARRRAARDGRRGDGGGRRRPRADGPVALAHRRPQARQRGRRPDRHPARRHRGDAGPGDERRHGGAAPPGPGGRRRRSTAAPRRASPAPTAATCASASRGAKGDPRRRRAHRARRLRQPALRRGVHRPGRTAEGTLVVDGSIAGIGLVDEPVELVVEGGHLTSARGGQGDGLHGAAHRARRGRHQRRRARHRHQREGDADRQRSSRTRRSSAPAHVAFGASAAIGGTVQVPVHLDCVVLKPTVELDGEPIVRDGELLV